MRTLSITGAMVVTLTGMLLGHPPGIRGPVPEPPNVIGGLPQVSPDGRLIAFFSTRDGRPGMYLMNSDGSEVRRLGAVNLDFGLGGWAPDSKSLLLFVRSGDSAGIFSATVDGSIRRLNGERIVNSATWLHGGGELLYSVGRPGSFRIRTSKPDGSGAQVLSPEGVVSFAPVASPDDRRIAFMRGGEIWVMNRDGSDARVVSGPEKRANSPTWSPDGQWIAYTYTARSETPPGQQWPQAVRADIMIVRPDGTDRRSLTTQPEDRVVETPSWYPDSKRLAVQVVRDGALRIAVLTLAGTLTELR